MTTENVLTDGAIPAEFWAVPEKFIKDESLRFLHAEVCARMRDENPGADTLELMAIERITSLFFYMRDRERLGGMASDSAYKSMMSLWVSMAADLRKSRSGLSEEEATRTRVLQDVANGIKSALKGMDPEVAIVVKRRIAESLGAS